MRNQLLLIEDDLTLAKSMQRVLLVEGYAVDLCARGDDGLMQARLHPYDLVITDLKVPGIDGLNLIAQLHATNPRLPIIMMTAHGTTETAIEATKLGAFQYLVKPFEMDELFDCINSAITQANLASETIDVGSNGPQGYAIIGNSRVMQQVYREIGRVAATPLAVLIRGATGTGKEMIARAIYQHSNRADKPLIAVNCAAIPDALLESELFGHERGAFTGAELRRIGRFEQAHQGTIFLDEIGDLNLSSQAKLLRVLQEKCIQRLGGNQIIPVDVRILTATHRDLETAIKNHEFREDLYYRLSGVTIRLPSLNERTEDIPDLVKYFIQRHANELGISNPSIHPDAIALFNRTSWPGNVRELENIVRQTLLLARPFGINVDHVEHALAKARIPSFSRNQSYADYISNLLMMAQRGEITDVYARMLNELEPELYGQAIKLAKGNQAQAARWLGVTRLKMREKLTELGLHPALSESIK